jgi:glycosyltransferase involved in cell wall biosynthesis
MYTATGRRSIVEGVDFAQRLYRPLIALKPDLIDCSSVSYAAIPVCAAVARQLKAKLVITWHEFWGRYWSQYLPYGLATAARLFERVLPLAAHANVAVSRFTAARLRSGSGARAQVVPNGIDLQSISSVQPSTTSVDVLFVGRLIREKRVPLLLEAVRKVAGSLRSLRVDIIGEGPERQTIQSLIETMPGNVHVDLLAPLDKVEDLYSRIKASKMLVLPSDREGYGLIVAEAQACGTVPIVTHGRANASVELIDPGKTGMITNAGADELAAAIETLYRRADLRASMAEQARAASISRDWSHTATSTVNLYRCLA